MRKQTEKIYYYEVVLILIHITHVQGHCYTEEFMTGSYIWLSTLSKMSFFPSDEHSFFSQTWHNSHHFQEVFHDWPHLSYFLLHSFWWFSTPAFLLFDHYPPRLVLGDGWFTSLIEDFKLMKVSTSFSFPSFCDLASSRHRFWGGHSGKDYPFLFLHSLGF